jgi:hypothetical protein
MTPCSPYAQGIMPRNLMTHLPDYVVQKTLVAVTAVVSPNLVCASVASMQARCTSKLTVSVDHNTKFHQYLSRNEERSQQTGSSVSILGSVYVLSAKNVIFSRTCSSVTSNVFTAHSIYCTHVAYNICDYNLQWRYRLSVHTITV